MNESKIKFYLDKLEKQFPDLSKLNQGQMLKAINKSRATFKRIMESNDLHLIPKFKSIEHKRSGAIYNTYTFDVYDIAIFLADN